MEKLGGGERPRHPPGVAGARRGNPSGPPWGNPRGNPQPEIPPPIQDPGEPPQPEELPGRMPDELPVRGPDGPRTPSPATDSDNKLARSEPDVNPGQPEMPRGTM